MASPGLLHVFTYDERAFEESHPDSMHDTRALVTPGRRLWVNVNGTSDAEALESLEKDYGIHPLTLEDIQHTNQRPKVEEYPTYLYVVTQMIKHDEEGTIDTEQVSILLGDGWIVTIQEGKPGDVFEGIRARIRGGRPIVRKSGPDYLMYAILDAIVDAYFPVLEIFGNRAEALEDEILVAGQRDVREHLQSLRRDLVTLKRVAWPMRDAITHLERSELRWIHRHTRTFLRDVSDHSSRVIDFVETSRELVASLMDLYLANVTQKTNDVMRVLTVVGTIFLPLTFIVGIYGMNFRVMPELAVAWAYPAVLAFCAALGIGMYVAFRRRGWV